MRVDVQWRGETIVTAYDHVGYVEERKESLRIVDTQDQHIASIPYGAIMWWKEVRT